MARAGPTRANSVHGQQRPRVHSGEDGMAGVRGWGQQGRGRKAVIHIPQV